jgi:hypothetical protein
LMTMIAVGKNYIYSKEHPNSSISISSVSSLPMPEVIICNWNQEDTLNRSNIDPSTGKCFFDACDLELVACNDWNFAPDQKRMNCSNLWTRVPVETGLGTFNCFR